MNSGWIGVKLLVNEVQMRLSVCVCVVVLVGSGWWCVCETYVDSVVYVLYS